MFTKLFSGLFYKTSKKTQKKDFEWEKFQKIAKEQFIWLHEKGIKFPIMTL